MLKPSVEVSEQDGVLLAEFWDCLRLDPAPVRELRDEFEAHLRRGGGPNVVADLLGIDFAGSSALGGFLALRKLGARIIFCNVEPTVLEVFRASKLLPLFAFEPDREAALARAIHAPEASDSAKSDKESSSSPPPLPRPSTAPPLRRLRDRARSRDSES